MTQIVFVFVESLPCLVQSTAELGVVVPNHCDHCANGFGTFLAAGSSDSFYNLVRYLLIWKFMRRRPSTFVSFRVQTVIQARNIFRVQTVFQRKAKRCLQKTKPITTGPDRKTLGHSHCKFPGSAPARRPCQPRRSKVPLGLPLIMIVPD